MLLWYLIAIICRTFIYRMSSRWFYVQIYIYVQGNAWNYTFRCCSNGSANSFSHQGGATGWVGHTCCAGHFHIYISTAKITDARFFHNDHGRARLSYHNKIDPILQRIISAIDWYIIQEHCSLILVRVKMTVSSDLVRISAFTCWSKWQFPSCIVSNRFVLHTDR